MEERHENDGVEKKENGNVKAYTGTLVFAAIASYIGSVGMGTALGYSSPAIPLMQSYDKPLNINQNEADWFGSILNVGALIGGPIGGMIIQKFGRRSGLVWVSVPFVLGWLLITYASHLAMLLVGRFLTGFAVGVVSISVPIFIAEISPPSIRGQLMTGVQLSVTLGLVYSFALGSLMYWTWLSIACSVLPLIMAFLVLFVHETPIWLLKNGQPQKCLRALVYLRSSEWDVNEEFQDLSNFVQKQAGRSSFSISLLKDPMNYKPFLIAMAMMFGQQFCGINAVLFYSASIFEHAGSSLNSNVSTILVGLTQVFGTLFASFIMDKAGRRILLLISGMGMMVSHIIFAVYYYLVEIKGTEFQMSYGWLPLLCLIMFNFLFAIGFGPVPWILLGELIPSKIQGFAGGFLTGFNWLCSFIVTKEFNTIVAAIKPYGAYSIFAGCCLLSSIIVIIFLPETKGHTLEQIEQKFAPTPSHKKLEDDLDTIET